MTLRSFREKWLLNNAPGRWFCKQYYNYSPPMADMIRDRVWARAITRAALAPIVVIAGAAIGNPGDIAQLLSMVLLGIATIYILKRRKPACGRGLAVSNRIK